MREFAHEYSDALMQVPTELQKEGGVYILRSGFNRAKPNYAVGPRMIECYSFHFILEGNLLLKDEEREFSLQAGQMFCLFPNVSYTYQKASTASLSMYWLAFAGTQAPSIVSQFGVTPDRPFITIAIGQRISSLMKRIHATIGKKDPFLQQSLLYELFGELDNTHAERVDWLEYCATYMQLHCSEAIRVESMANELGIHRSHFSNAFREKYGMSPKQYLTSLRMSKAIELLQNTDLPINEIAQTAGYPDPFAFTRAFVKYYGRPPSDYRKSVKELESDRAQ